MVQFTGPWEGWLLNGALIVGSIAIAFVVHYVLFALLDRYARQPRRVVEASLVRHGRGPSKLVFPLIGLLLAVPKLTAPSSVTNPIEHVIGLALIASIAWFVILAAEVFSDVLMSRHNIDVADNLQGRKVQTRVLVLQRVFKILVVVMTAGIMLLTIPHVRAIGTSLLASAGLAGLVIGMAAKPTLGNLLAGIQVALTQPIRLGDAVIMENDWGWVEEITSTYVVMKTWDWRRWVLPLSYLIEQPYQVWTRTNAELIGIVRLYVDYTAPIDEMRKELDRIVHATDRWRGEVCVLQVTHVTERIMELRALADAKDSGTAWDLRCDIREKLIVFLQKNYPQCLPKTRMELENAPNWGHGGESSGLSRQIADAALHGVGAVNVP